MVDIVRVSSGNQVNKIPDRPAAKAPESRTNASSTSQSDSIDIGAGAREASVVQRLVSVAQAEPNVRADAVAAAKEKLANGEFSTREAFEGAAKGILGIS